MALKCVMPVLGQSGWELFCRHFIEGVHRLGVKVWLDPKLRWNAQRIPMASELMQRLEEAGRIGVDEKDPVIFQQVPIDPEIEAHKASRKKVCISIFETDKVPKVWAEQFKKVDEVWTFSEFNYKGWKPDVPTIKKIPIPRLDIFENPKTKPANIENKKTFAFLANGDLTERKNFYALVRAFVEEFTDKDDVCLVIKAHFLSFTKAAQDRCFTMLQNTVRKFRDKNLPRILFFGSKISEEALPSLYRACDCYVLPSRGEGIGLPLMEAKQCGLEVITTGWGAQTEFLDNENAWLVDYDLDIIDSVSYIQKCPNALNHKWASVKVDDLRKKMRMVYEGQRKPAPLKNTVSYTEFALWVLKELEVV